MPDCTATFRRIDQLTSQIADAERAAGMTRLDVAKARARMELDIVMSLEGAGSNATPAFALYVRVAALHARLRGAEGRRSECAVDAEPREKTGMLAQTVQRFVVFGRTGAVAVNPLLPPSAGVTRAMGRAR